MSDDDILQTLKRGGTFTIDWANTQQVARYWRVKALAETQGYLMEAILSANRQWAICWLKPPRQTSDDHDRHFFELYDTANGDIETELIDRYDDDPSSYEGTLTDE